MTIELTNQIVKQAMDLQESYRLRAYDAIQLASALQIENRIATIGQHLMFIGADAKLLIAATSAGLQTDNPNNHA